MIRKAVVSGQFYEGTKEALLKQIEECFRHEKGPGMLPGTQRKGKILGAIVPHAGYIYSGPCAAHSYKAIAESEIPNVYVILGPSHMGFHKTCFSLDYWETPLGLVKTNDKLGQIMEDNKLELIPLPHNEEHSIEVQIPFLQYITQKQISKLKILPIIVAETDWEDMIPMIKKSIEEFTAEKKKNVIIIASSDFTHYGVNYGYLPFNTNVKENLHNLDKGAIDRIKKMDSKDFLRYCDTTGATICGKYPIAVLIELLKGKSQSAELLQYYASGDILGDYRNAVGYGSMIFR